MKENTLVLKKTPAIVVDDGCCCVLGKESLMFSDLAVSVFTGLVKRTRKNTLNPFIYKGVGNYLWDIQTNGLTPTPVM